MKYLHTQGNSNVTIDDVKILEIYGHYNGVVVVRMERGAYEVITEIQVGEVDFTFENTNTPLVWKDGEFYEFENAYEQGLLTKTNLLDIAQKVNANLKK